MLQLQFSNPIYHRPQLLCQPNIPVASATALATAVTLALAASVTAASKLVTVFVTVLAAAAALGATWTAALHWKMWETIILYFALVNNFNMAESTYSATLELARIVSPRSSSWQRKTACPAQVKLPAGRLPNHFKSIQLEASPNKQCN